MPALGDGKQDQRWPMVSQGRKTSAALSLNIKHPNPVSSNTNSNA